MACFIGLMSGTSLDGVDGVLVDFGVDGAGRSASRTLAQAALPLPDPLRAELLALNRSGLDELHRAMVAAEALVRCQAAVVAQLQQQAGLAADAITAIGAHGQTVRHRPHAAADGSHAGYTLQLMNGALLAELTGIDVVCDFRSRDVAAGGEGAPLVPAFHAARFGLPGHERAVLNLGGIANLSLLRADGDVLGFDTGPANVLLDGWCRRHTGAAYDRNGAWAAGGRVLPALLRDWLQEPYFARMPPKSTGRDLFDSEWLDARLPAGLDPRDVMATLADLTACSVAEALRRHAPAAELLLVCGGGARNDHLMARLRATAQSHGLRAAVQSTAEHDVPPEAVEALAFAWLAQACLQRRPGNLPAVTGARGPRVLGAVYPAR